MELITSNRTYRRIDKVTRVITPPRTEPLNITPHSYAAPSRHLCSVDSPMPWVPAANTDVTKTWARAAQKGGVL